MYTIDQLKPWARHVIYSDVKEHTLENVSQISIGAENLSMKNDTDKHPRVLETILTKKERIKGSRCIQIEPCEGIANIRIKTKNQNTCWKYTLKMGGVAIDHGSNARPIGPWMGRDGRAIPFYPKQPIELDFVTEGEVKVCYDIVRVDGLCDERVLFKHGIVCNGPPKNGLVDSSMKLELRNPIYKIFAKINKDIDAMYITFDDFTLKVPFVYNRASNLWVCTFQEPVFDGEARMLTDPINPTHVNGGRVDIYIHVVSNDKSCANIEYWSENYNCMATLNGLCGLSFSA